MGKGGACRIGNGGDAGGGNARLGTDNARDLQLHAVLGDEGGGIVIKALAHVGPHGLIALFRGVGAVGLGKEICRGQKHKLGVKKLVEGEGDMYWKAQPDTLNPLGRLLKHHP